ncbi:hypothetical protein HAHE_23010 [Haloferula helveola]|uniref:Uncharacterized protein n=1 Tax=Haloferula helveola TaxID=490095 RepID=A0ABM7REG4_9BACT|nr:hypothetical protein HAHE_23010 [Haloferula helveola]
MSDQENPPSKQTSSVPLKKETVRVTLKAADAPAASPTGAAPAPAAPKPTAAPKPPTAPKPPSPTVGAPPAPTVGGKAPAPAPTIPLRTAGGSSAPGAPAPTIKLNTGGAASKPGPPITQPAGGPGAPSAPAPGPTVALPKATVQLQPPTQPLGTAAPAASQMATMQVSEEDAGTGSNGIVNVLSILGFLGAAAVIAIQLMTAAVWLGTDDQGEKQPIEWGNLF